MTMVSTNQQNFMDKELNQAFMVRYKSINKCIKSKSETDKQIKQAEKLLC